MAITAIVTVWNTTHYVGPFHFESITRSVLSAQLFIAVAALSTLCLAAVVTERELFSARLERVPVAARLGVGQRPTSVSSTISTTARSSA